MQSKARKRKKRKKKEMESTIRIKTKRKRKWKERQNCEKLCVYCIKRDRLDVKEDRKISGVKNEKETKRLINERTERR